MVWNAVIFQSVYTFQKFIDGDYLDIYHLAMSRERFVLSRKIVSSVLLPVYIRNYWDSYEYFTTILELNYLRISWCTIGLLT